MRNKCSFLLSAILAGSAFTVILHSTPLQAQGAIFQSEERREASTEAFRDGYLHGQEDAKAGIRNDTPGDRWTLSSDQMAWRDGYAAGYQETMSQSAAPAPPSPDLNSGPARYGYEDGLAQGRRDRDKGAKFRPTDSNFYKRADHGWSDTDIDKDHYKQVYRQAYAKGYEQGYNGNVPR
jgi:hypothetical protein